jgi:hypothetical protein
MPTTNLPPHFTSYLVIETRKDGTKFTNRGLKEAAERQADVAGRYEQLQKDLVAQVGVVVGVGAVCLLTGAVCLSV